jgi:hypothetical protein
MGLSSGGKVKKALFLGILFLGAYVEAGSVRLANNSSFKLRAEVRAADGTYLGEVIVNPQQTMQWTDYWGGIGNYNASQTPYTIVWYCADGGDFAVCEDVATGATVVSMNCDGLRQCKPRKEEQHPPLKGTPRQEFLPNQTEPPEPIERAPQPPQPPSQ